MRRTMRFGLRRWFLTAAMSLSVPVFTYAKPPDLPADLGINFAGADQPLAPETPALPFEPAQRNATPAAERLDPVAALFQQAENDRSQGRTLEARKGYERVHLLAPTSPEGILAMERLQSLERPANGFSEEQEPPVARTSNRRPIRDLSEAEEPSATPPVRMRVPKRTREEIRRILEMLRDTEPLGMVPSGPGSF